MLYLLDANVLIDANRDYYPLERVPEFWDWLEYQGTVGAVKIPVEVHEEVNEGQDALGSWARLPPVKEALLFDEEADQALVDRTGLPRFGSSFRVPSRSGSSTTMLAATAKGK